MVVIIVVDYVTVVGVAMQGGEDCSAFGVGAVFVFGFRRILLGKQRFGMMMMTMFTILSFEFTFRFRVVGFATTDVIFWIGMSSSRFQRIVVAVGRTDGLFASLLFMKRWLDGDGVFIFGRWIAWRGGINAVAAVDGEIIELGDHGVVVRCVFRFADDDG